MEEKKAAEAFRVQQHRGPHPAAAAAQFSQPFPLPTSNSLSGAASASVPTTQLCLIQHSAGPPPPIAPDTDRCILHFDADCFYAQCEELRDPSLCNKPLGVTQKFLIVTSNYVARERGVTKLMAISEAVKKCPDLVLINGEDLTPYRDASKRMLSVLRRYGTVSKLGLDEIFVDVTAEVERRLTGGVSCDNCEWAGHFWFPGLSFTQDSRHRPMDLRAGAKTHQVQSESQLPSLLAASFSREWWWPRLALASIIAREAREAVKVETGLRTSAGIACNKMLAKLVSGLHKPSDQTIMLPPFASTFVELLPVRALPGIGYKTDEELKKSGIETVGQTRGMSELELKQKFGDRAGGLLSLARWGNDPSEVVEQGPPKSVTVEDSFRSCQGYAAAAQVIQVLAPDLAARLLEDEEEHTRRPSRLSLKWRYKGQGWNRTSASCPFPAAALNNLRDSAACAAAIAGATQQLFAANVKEPFDLTLISIGATGFVDGVGAPAGRSIVDMLRGGPSSAKSAAASSLPVSEQQPSFLPKAISAEESAKRRRDYGFGDGAAVPLSKRAERMMRQGGELSRAGLNSSGAAIVRNGGQFALPNNSSDDFYALADTTADGGIAADADEDDLWDDLAGLHTGKRPRLVVKTIVKSITSGSGGQPASSTSTAAEAAPSQDHRVIIHCDIDCFYCSVERLDDSSLIGIPLAVEQFNSGGFVAVSYEARDAGIRCGDGAGAAGRVAVPHLAAMNARSIEECKAACPGLIVKRMRPQRYREVGKAVHALLKRLVGPQCPVEKASCDDFYIDVTSLCYACGDFDTTSPPPTGIKFIHQDAIWDSLDPGLQRGALLAHRLRQTLSSEMNLTASCAVGRNKLIARLASPIHKPNGLAVVPDSAAVPFIRTVPIRKIPSLRAKFGAEVESSLNIKTVGDLAQFTHSDLVSRFGDQRGSFLSNLPLAIDPGPVIDRGPPKTLTSERSFPPAANQAAVAVSIRSLVDELLLRAVEDSLEYSNRLPSKFGVSYRLGYNTNVASRSGQVPIQLARWLKGVHQQQQVVDGSNGAREESAGPAMKEAAEAATSAAMALLSNAVNGRWDLTRAAVVLYYAAENTSQDGPSIGDFLRRKAQDAVAAVAVPSIKQQDPSAAAAAAAVKQQKQKNASADSIDPQKKKKPPAASYRNEEALKLQALFSAGNGGGQSHSADAMAAADEEENASLALAMKLQKEEAEAAARIASSSQQQANRKKVTGRRGPLDGFFKPQP